MSSTISVGSSDSSSASTLLLFSPVHVSGDILLLLVPPPSLLSSLLLPAGRRLIQGHALWPLREVRPGFITGKSLQNGQLEVKL